MSLTGFKAQNHPQQTRYGAAAKDEIDDRATTLEEFGKFDARWDFTVDVAAAAHNTKCERFYSIEDDGLSQSWAGERVWCNPPYSNIRPWVEKAWDAWVDRIDGPQPGVIVMLVPANRTEQAWWQQLVEPQLRAQRPDFRCEFLAGRMRFLRKGATEIGPNERPPFGVCLLIWGPRRTTQ